MSYLVQVLYNGLRAIKEFDRQNGMKMGYQIDLLVKHLEKILGQRGRLFF